MIDTDLLHRRNLKVEADKAWEESYMRRFLIASGTYIIIGAYLSFLDVDRPWMHAFVPCGAYILSTLSLPVFKRFWIQRIYKV